MRWFVFFGLATLAGGLSPTPGTAELPTVNFDNNQHSPNENLRLGHFFDSIVTFAAIFTM